MLNGLDLFSGIGGIGVALRPWVRTIAYCERERYAQAVLLSRMRTGDIDEAPIWDDVQTLSADHLPRVDIIYGGFPCQDISVAGSGKGLGGERSGLFFEIVRLARDLRPSFIFLENSPAIATRGIDRVLLEFNALGFDCRWTVVSAAEVGACHQRDRWFLLAHSNRFRERQSQGGKRYERRRAFDGASEIANTDGEFIWEQQIKVAKCEEAGFHLGDGGEGQTSDLSKSRLERGWRRHELCRPAPYNGWTSEPIIRGRVHGVSYRVDRIKGLGNSVVPKAAREAFIRLIGGRLA